MCSRFPARSTGPTRAPPRSAAPTSTAPASTPRTSSASPPVPRPGARRNPHLLDRGPASGSDRPRQPRRHEPAAELIPTAGSSPHGIMLQRTGVFWTHTFNALSANRAGQHGRQRAGQPSVRDRPHRRCCVRAASDGDEMFWANNGDPGRISSVHGAFGPRTTASSPPTDHPCGIAVAGGFVYWTNRDAGTIGRANLNGANRTPPSSRPAVPRAAWRSTAPTSTGPTSRATRSARAPLDGTPDMTGFSIDAGTGSRSLRNRGRPSAVPSPTGQAFAAPSRADRATSNRSRSPTPAARCLTSPHITILGANPAEFEITGDSCTTGLTPAAAAASSTCASRPRARALAPRSCRRPARTARCPPTSSYRGWPRRPRAPADPGGGESPPLCGY